MENSKVHESVKTVILCGGSGTRLWPISRRSSPKQFAKIFEGRSLFEMTVERNKKASDSFLVVVNEAQLPLCKEQIENGDESTLFLAESIGRNTAPAIAMAALACSPEDLLLVLPSDHLIKDMELYQTKTQEALKLARENNLVTFGIKASYPETGFGYIEAQGNDVLSFKEKPHLDLAKKYVESGKYFWNSGMFCFKARVFLDELQKHSPEIHQACAQAFSEISQASNSDSKKDTLHLSAELMKKIPADSIDYAVMEKSDKVKVVPSNFYWSDMGSFDSLYDELEKDEQGNTKSESYFQLNSKRNLVLGGKKVIATFDVEDLIIVDTEDALLIGKRGESQQVKELMQAVTQKRPDLSE